MTEEEIKNLFSAPGLYILEDGRCPGSTIPVAVMSDTREHGGQEVIIYRAFILHPKCELSPDPAQWTINGTTNLVGGPYSVAVCDMLEKDGQRLFALEEAVKEAKEFARLYRDMALKEGLQNVAEAMQIILDALHPPRVESP